MEFYKPDPKCFNNGSVFRVPESIDYLPLENIDDNIINILFTKFIDNNLIHKYIKYLDANGIKDIREIVYRCINRFFPKLDHNWDINDTNLNIEVQ